MFYDGNIKDYKKFKTIKKITTLLKNKYAVSGACLW
jgi:hypothetical protein